jgi:hypothetical protein
MINLYDREVIAAEKVMQVLNAKVGSQMPMESFRREIIERFEEIGLIVDTFWHTTNVPGCFAPDIIIRDRCEPLRHGFDFDEHQWEVLGDKLGIDKDKSNKVIPFDVGLMHEQGLGKHSHAIADEEIHKVEKHHD